MDGKDNILDWRSFMYLQIFISKKIIHCQNNVWILFHVRIFKNKEEIRWSFLKTYNIYTQNDALTFKYISSFSFVGLLSIAIKRILLLFFVTNIHFGLVVKIFWQLLILLFISLKPWGYLYKSPLFDNLKKMHFHHEIVCHSKYS